jgi:hypothetical protein
MLATSVGLVLVHVPCCVLLRAHTNHAHHSSATATTRVCETAKVSSDTICNDPPPYLGHQEYLHRPTHVFPMHFILTHAHPGRTSWLVTHCSRSSTLNFGVFGDGLPERKLQLIGTSVLINPIKSWPGCHIHPPLEDRRPHQSTPIQERFLLATFVGLVLVHVPCCVTTQGPH